jgi:miniconductance mechanosensitive channel
LFPPAQDTIQRLSLVYMILAGLFAFNSFLNAVVDIYNTFEIAREKPIKGYVQISMIIISIFGGIFALSTLLNRSPWPLLSGLGAMTAILLLIFKDSILGLVASIQLSVNDMVRIGDWIEMPKFNADGDVIDVSLHTVKVRNWDKTITTIPAYALIADSFKNWRGMSESGGRRIKRAINIDMTSVKFCTPEMLDRYEKFQLLTDHVRSKRKEIVKYNAAHSIDTSELINGRNLTNIGTFRNYLVAYLRHHPKIHNDMTFLIRQLPPREHGLPIEVYVFSNDQAWANYEDIQADIFDHILAVLPEFDLRVFQQPSGSDVRALADMVSHRNG